MQPTDGQLVLWICWWLIKYIRFFLLCVQHSWHELAIVSGFLADWTCRICGVAWRWEKSLWLAVQLKRISAWEEKWKRKVKVPRARHCSFHDLIYLGWFVLIFCLHLFANAILNFLSDLCLIRSGYVGESDVKICCFIITLVCISVKRYFLSTRGQI